MIRIAYILTPITFGGSEKVSLNFLRHVDRQRYHIQPILLTRPWEDEPYFARELRRYGYQFESVPVAVRRNDNLLRVPRVAARLFAILRNGSFHLAHTHGYFADICGLPAARLLGIPGISTCHGFISNDRNLRLYNTLDRVALRLCARIMAVSEGIRDDLLRSGIDGARVEVVRNTPATGLGEGDFLRLRKKKRIDLAVGPHEVVVGFAGRLSREKGVEHLIEAACGLIRSGVPFKLVIMGDGPRGERLTKLAQEMRLDGHVVFTGFREDTESWFPAFDVFVLPSLTEGTPMALLEAMDLGIPVVASSVGGVPAVVQDGINGFLVPPGDSGAIRERLLRLAGEPDLRRMFSRAGKDMVSSRYNISDWSRRIEGMYESLVNGKCRQVPA